MKPLRIPCAHGCGTMALSELGECRKCKRKRLHAGAKRIYKLRKEPGFWEKLKLMFETAKQKFQRAKSIRWARPRRTVRGLYINQKPPVRSDWTTIHAAPPKQ